MMRRTARPLLALLLLVAAALGCARLSPERERVLSAVDDYLGAPYVAAGNGERGFDCSGLVQTIFRQAGLTLPRSVAEQTGACPRVARWRLRPGDLVFFGGEGGQANHCGIYLGRGRFAHASSSQGVTVSGLEDAYWGERFLFGCDCLGE